VASYSAFVPPTWFWFVVALVAAGGGALLLLSERSPARSASSRSRERRRWAEQKSWEFVDADPVLPSRWRYGTVHQGGHGRAIDLATGAVPGPGGRRLAHVFDHEQGGRVTGVVAAVRGVATVPVALELRLPSAPLPDDAGLDSLGQIGDRYAFVTGARDGRHLLTDEVARTADLVGDDVPLVWAEDTWVLASTAAGADPERMQRVLQALVEVSVALEKAVDGEGDTAEVIDADRTDDDAPGDDAPGDDAPGDDTPGDDTPGDDAPGDLAADRDDDTAEIRPDPTHRDRPGDIPYDLEHDEPGSDVRSAPRRR